MSGRIDWARAASLPGLKRTGEDEYHGACPVTGAGRDAFWVRPADQLIGCRKCGDGSGRLTGEQVLEHARALDLLDVDVDLGAAAWPSWTSWTWTTATGVERLQYRTPDGEKKWQTKGGPHPRPGELLYLPDGLPSGPGAVVYLTEGASDADALLELGLRVIGRPGANPTKASLARLDAAAVYRLFPDHDDAGYRQALAWHRRMTEAGLRVEIVEPLKLRPDAPAGYDARNWIGELPDGVTADTAAAALDSAVTDVDAIKARIPKAPPVPERYDRPRDHGAGPNGQRAGGAG